MKDFEYDDLQLKFREDGSVLYVSWEGSIHAANPSEFLDPVVDEILNLAEKSSYEVVSNFKKLEYMNSSTIPVLVNLLRGLADRELKGKFIYDKSRMVQVASFKALNVIASKSGFVEIIGE